MHLHGAYYRLEEEFPNIHHLDREVVVQVDVPLPVVLIEVFALDDDTVRNEANGY